MICAALQAFWTLTWMHDRLLPQYFTTVHHIGLQLYSCVFAEMVAQFLPNLAAHLTAMGIQPRDFGTRWLPLCFTGLPLYATSIVVMLCAVGSR